MGVLIIVTGITLNWAVAPIRAHTFFSFRVDFGFGGV